MPYILGIITLLGLAYFWMSRVRDAADMTSELVDFGSDLLGAARRWNFRRRNDVHPVEAVEEPELAAGALAVAFAGLGSLPTQEHRTALLKALQSELDLSLTDAEELVTLGQWLVNQCGSAEQAVPRLAKRLMRLGGAEALDPVLEIVRATASVDGGLTDKQREALADAARVFRRT